MMTSNFGEYRDKDLASKFLGKKLKEGTLTLFLGAGTSKGFGLPDWTELVNELRVNVGLNKLVGTPTADELQLRADELRQKMNSDNDLIDAIEKILYRDFSTLSLNNVMENKLLVAISALLMGSKRGHVRRVVTLNYDNMLEWFLSLFGFVVKTVHTLPSLEGAEDVTIFHPHGFIPRLGSGAKSSNFLILGMKEVNKRIGTQGDPWYERVRHLLDTGVCLFIGMSNSTLNDRVLSGLLTTCGEKCAMERPLGFWLNWGEIMEMANLTYESYNIIPLQVDNQEHIVDFLMSICQSAANI